MNLTAQQLDIVMVSYNTVDLTIRAIESIYKETVFTQFNLIVVDNNSHDGSADRIAKTFPDCHLIRNPRNTGFSGGVNLGARQSNSENVLLINPDTVVLDGAIDKLYQFASKHPKQGIWGGITLNNDMSINTHNAWAKPSTRTLLFSALGLSKAFKKSCFFNQANYGCWPRDTQKEVDMLQGCFFLTTRNLWDQLGGLDETFFMYGEESDYCLKAAKLGYRPLVTPQAQIIHHGGASEVSFSGKMIKLLKGKVELVNRHSPSWKIPLHKALLSLYVINQLVSYHLIALIKTNKKPQAQEWKKVIQAHSSWIKGWNN